MIIVSNISNYYISTTDIYLIKCIYIMINTDKEVGSMKQFMEVRSHHLAITPCHSHSTNTTVVANVAAAAAAIEPLLPLTMTEDYDTNVSNTTVLVTELKETTAAETTSTLLLYDQIVTKLIQNFMQVFEAEIGSTISNQDAINYLDEL